MEKPSSTGKITLANCHGAGVIKTVRRGRARLFAWPDRFSVFTTRHRSQRIYPDLPVIPDRYSITQ
ncbi:hypothetical protein D3C81_1939820 [compost metagenome]